MIPEVASGFSFTELSFNAYWQATQSTVPLKSEH